MNAFEIAEAVSKLSGEPFDPANFPFAFLEAFGNKDTTIARLRNGSSNGSNVPGAVLQRSNIHLAVCASDDTAKMLETLKASAATKKQKAGSGSISPHASWFAGRFVAISDLDKI